MRRARSVIMSVAGLLVPVVVALAVAACSASTSGAARTVTITHGAVTPTGTVAGGADGVGTVRLFHAPVSMDGGGSGTFDAMMTTTSVDQAAGTEVRITTLDFVLGGGADQLVIEGSAVYPAAGSTIKTADTVVRPVVGGSGAYAGARGWAESTHLADGTWRHVFHLEP